VLITAAVAATLGSLAVDPKWAQVVGHCKTPARASKKEVWVFKQWHLAPSVDTHDRARAAKLPQAVNQTALYRQLEAWITAKKIDALVAEGCSGELTRASALKINGWSMPELEAASRQPKYDKEVVGSVALKLEAKHGDALRTLCGDDEASMKESLLAFSDARGILGYMTRLEENRDNPAKARNYLDGAIGLLKLPRDSTIDQVMPRLGSELKKAIERVHASLEKRNEKAVEAALSAPGNRVALVFGGLHAAGIQKALEKKGVACTVVQPSGYQDDEAKLLQRLDSLLNVPNGAGP
jgi:hypothetical protein